MKWASGLPISPWYVIGLIVVVALVVPPALRAANHPHETMEQVAIKTGMGELVDTQGQAVIQPAAAKATPQAVATVARQWFEPYKPPPPPCEPCRVKAERWARALASDGVMYPKNGYQQ